jgi:hypothetical protein
MSLKLSASMKLIILSVVKLSFFGTSFVIFAYNLNTLIIITLLLIKLYVIKLTTTLSEGRKLSPQLGDQKIGKKFAKFFKE